MLVGFRYGNWGSDGTVQAKVTRILNDDGQSEHSELSIPPIPLTEEEQRMLKQPLDPRVARILDDLLRNRDLVGQQYANRRILRFPCSRNEDDESPEKEGAIV